MRKVCSLPCSFTIQEHYANNVMQHWYTLTVMDQRIIKIDCSLLYIYIYKLMVHGRMGYNAYGSIRFYG